MDVLAKGRGSLARLCNGVETCRIAASHSLSTDLAALTASDNGDMYAALVTMLSKTPEERADVADCLRSRFVYVEEYY